MRFSDSEEEAAWRNEVRAFLNTELTEEHRRSGRRGSYAYAEAGESRRRDSLAPPPDGVLADWRRRLMNRGWVAPAWPREYGGAGMTRMQQAILNEEFAEAGAPQFSGLGLMMAGPTIIVHGTDAQKEQHLSKILSGEMEWCQGFSEPGAGSDLASLQTRAVRDGDEYVINGQKIWTTGAQNADWMFMLARTDPDAPKHRGISYFLLDMKTPGVSVQPLVNMAGSAAFNQVFFDNVRVPAENMVGELNRGWYVATTTLDFERSGIGSAVGVRKSVEQLIEWVRTNAEGNQSTLHRSATLRHELVDRYIEARIAKVLAYRVTHLQNQGQIPNYEASMAKLFSTELSQRIARTAMKSAGLYGLLWDSSPYAAGDGQYARRYVQSVSATIAGGTSEIQRNIIAQRGLGMPRG